MQQVLIAGNKPQDALEIAERGRARAFVELLASRLSADQPQQAIATPPTIEQIKQTAKAQNATLVQYSIIQDDVKTQGKYQESKLFIWVIKPTGEVAFRQVDLKPLWQCEDKGCVSPTSLADLVSSTRESMGVTGRASIVLVSESRTQLTLSPKEAFQQLHRVLIQPIADLLPTNPEAHVIFIPQKSLFLVPFPALQDDGGNYLLEQHTILTAPSIQVLDLTRRQRQLLPPRTPSVQGADVLVLGNPTMPSLSPKLGAPPQPLAPLPGAEQEAINVARILKTQAIVGDRGTKAAIVRRMPASRIIHLATHGLLDDIRGLGSAIALAPDPPERRSATLPSTPDQTEVNGLLTAEEILKLKLNAELVVLSACDTGRGRITGDGVIGLSRSLISAGVPSAIVSLWAVPDAPTASLMTEFYQNLQQNPDKAQSLRQAMLSIMKQRPNPRDWAAFTLIGEP